MFTLKKKGKRVQKPARATKSISFIKEISNDVLQPDTPDQTDLLKCMI